MLLFRITDEIVGPGKTCIAWRPNGSTLALASANKTVVLYDRKGAIIDVLDVTGNVIGMAWDKEGDVLGILTDTSSLAILWNINTKNAEQLDTAMGAKELPLCLAWSSVSPLLAIGNSNGNLFIYNQKMSRKIPVLGKHQRRVTGVAMTRQDEILCCSDDNTITVSSSDGETLKTLSLSGEPNDLKIGEVKRPGGNVDIIVSCVLARKTLFLSTLTEKPGEKTATAAAAIGAVAEADADHSMNLQFQEKYGAIVAHVWYNDGYMIVGFEKGFIVCISAHPSEMGQEIFSVAEYKTYLAAVAANQPFGKILTVGDHQIKVREMRELSDIFVIMEVDTEKDLSQVECSPDGQLVAVASRGGGVCTYLTKMPSMGAAYGDTMAILSSLNQITYLGDGDKLSQRGVVINIAIEPSLIAVGPYHVAAATNNRVWIYDVHQAGTNDPVAEGEYLSSVIDMKLNDEYICVMMEGRARLHRILNADSNPAVTFPEPSRNSRLLAAALSNHFLIFSTEAHYLVFFSLEEWCVVSEYRHTSLIRQVHPDQDGLRVTIFDDRAQTWVYSPIDDSMHKLPAVGSAIHYKAALWETFTIDRDTFIVYDNTSIYVYLLNRSQIEDESVIYIGSTKLPFAHTPLMLNKGIVHCLTPSGKTSGVLLESHRTDTILEGKSPTVVRDLLKQALQLKRWMYAWRICDYTRDLLDWNTFAQAALLNADAELALRIFRHIGDVSMGLALESIVAIEEKTLLAAYVSMLLGRYDQAEQLFLKSTRPIEALAMRRDLLDWSKALALAEQLSPTEIPYISREYAQQLEFMGDYPNALVHYENGIIENPDEETEQIQEHNEICRSGLARMSIRTGDIRKGIQLARDLHGRVVKRDCAIVLEQLKQYGEAADLYELGQFYDRAAAVCLKAKAWGKVGELLPKVRSPKIHAQYGKIMEAEKRYKEAAVSYRNARDYDNLVRMLLDHLNMAEEAVKVVRESRSVEGAKLVAKFFSKLGDHASAIRFLVLSNCHQEAFQLAETTDHMADYADSVETDGATLDQMAHLAEYFANAGDAHNAGRFYLRAGHYRAALEYLMSCGENHDSLLLAIECVAAAGDNKLTARLTDYLMGEVDEIPKDAKYLFRLYVALGMTREAATTAVVIARQEQERGSYTVARNVLLAMYQELVTKEIKVPYDMQNSLMIIHSYLIVRSLLKRNETLRAARMLIRTTANISRFPAHVVPILTSTVVVCSKAGLKSAAHRAAVSLMQPEYRQKIDAKYKKKIEALVRRADKGGDPDEPRPPCPHCAFPVPETDLACDNCKSTIPYCVVTGRHIVDSDFALCPSCNFPGYYSEFKKLLALDESCPMCSTSLKDVIPSDASTFLRKDKTSAEQIPI